MKSHPSLSVLHANVPGRLRLHVPILYRNAELKAWIENQLRQNAVVQGVQANPITGNVVVVFDPTQSSAQILCLIESCLARPDRPKLAPTQPRKDPPGQSIWQRLFKRSPKRDPSPNPYAAPPQAHWHALTWDEVLKVLDTSERGLSEQAARQRLARYGPNELLAAMPRSKLEIILEQLISPPTLLLGVSAAVSLATGGILDALVILTVVGLNTTIGYFTEASTEAILRGLESFTPLHAEVIRDGEVKSLPLAEVAVGDLLRLTPGSYVAADARLLVADNLTVDESALTGESLPVKKNAEILCQPLTPLAERHNLVYRGTVVTGGSGLAVAVATGGHTEIGLIQSLVEGAETLKTPMQRQLENLGLQLSLVSGAICTAVFAIGLIRGLGFVPMLKSAISLAVAAVPEGLPTIATTTLALGIRRMRARQALVRHLNAIENLGAVQVICFDKTGTLTLNQMEVTRLQTVNDLFYIRPGQTPKLSSEGEKLLQIVTLCSEVTLNGHEMDGSPTEKALLKCAQAAGIDSTALRARHPRISTVQRAEDRPFMVTHHRNEENFLIAVKGNPQAVLDLCTYCLREGRIEPLTAAVRAGILATNETLASDALRVLGVAYGESTVSNDQPADLIWLGLIGMEDAIRPGVAELIARFHRAGIETVMITGDQSATAVAVARQLNLNGDKPLEVIDSTRLDKVEPELLRHWVKDVTVFARVSPAHKLKIVRALQESGKVVAMIGDGINDAPALKASDVGVAMGQRGTDVARSVADIVLADDNLETLYAAIEQGRTIYANIQKSLRFLLSTNMSEIQLMLAGVMLGTGEMLSPMQLLWINLLTDIFPGLALSLEPSEEDVMIIPPRDPEHPILDQRTGTRLARESLTLTLGSLGVYGYGRLRYGPGPQTEGLVFQTITLAQLLHALSCRSETLSVLAPSQARNPYLIGAIGFSLAIQIAALLFPPLRALLGLSLPTWSDILAIGTGAAAPLVVNETFKLISLKKSP
ncbi:MAG: cation-transporting P-type ATPase [Methylohalobius sp.]|nr:cation-transporting P-type ATPase [Methylohalobius sp.]